jgi:DNA-binding MarR family transcriptional regulator
MSSPFVFQRPAADQNRRCAAMMINTRRRRLQFFTPSMFGEPAWDMLLALLVRDRFATSLSLTALGAESGAPASSGLRWISYLEDHDLITRNASGHDQRIQLVELTEKARDLFSDFFLAEEAGSPTHPPGGH